MEILTRYRPALLDAVEALMADQGEAPLLDMARYHMGLAEVDGTPSRTAVGKMIRPTLCLAVCEALGGVVDDCLPAAVSLEIVHRTSLVFDDIQDNSRQRNHRDTVWEVCGVNQALNVGLALSAIGRLALQGMTGRVDTALILLVERRLEEAVVDLCRGQYQDLDFLETLPTVAGYMEMIRLKTGVLVGASCQVGALVAGAMHQAAAARRFGEALGVAFQLHDDYLGVWGQPEVVGKAPNDLEERKRSLPVILAGQASPMEMAQLLDTPGEAATAELLGLLEALAIRPAAQELAQAVAGQALLALKDLHLKPTWEDRFEQLIQFVVSRAV